MFCFYSLTSNKLQAGKKIFLTVLVLFLVGMYVITQEVSPTLLSRAATVVGIPKISRYTDFFQNSYFWKLRGVFCYMSKNP